MPISVQVEAKQPKSILKDRNLNTVNVKSKAAYGKLPAGKTNSAVAAGSKGATNFEVDSDAVPRKFDLLRAYSPNAHRLVDPVDEFAVPEPSLLFEESNLHIDDESLSKCSGTKSPLALSCSSSPIKPSAGKQRQAVNGMSKSEVASSESQRTKENDKEHSSVGSQTAKSAQVRKESPKKPPIESTATQAVIAQTSPSQTDSASRAETQSSGVTAPVATADTKRTLPQPLGVGQPGSAYPYYGYAAWQPQSLYAAANAFWLSQLQQHAAVAGYPAQTVPVPIAGLPGYHLPSTAACTSAQTAYPHGSTQVGPVPNAQPVTPLLGASPNMYRLLIEQDRQLKQLQEQVAQLLTAVVPQPQQNAVAPAQCNAQTATGGAGSDAQTNRDVQTMTTATNTTILWQQTTTTTTRTTMTTLIEQQAGSTPKKNANSNDNTPRKNVQSAARVLTRDAPSSSTPDERANTKRQVNAITSGCLFDDHRKDDSLFESEGECPSESDAETETRRQADRHALGSTLSDNVFGDEMRDSSSDDVRLTSLSSIEQPRRCDVDNTALESPFHASNDPPLLRIVRDLEDEVVRKQDTSNLNASCEFEHADADASLPKLVHVEMAESFRTESSRFAAVGQPGSTLSHSSLNATASSVANRHLELSCGALLERINVLLNSSMLQSRVSSACEPQTQPPACGISASASEESDVQHKQVGRVAPSQATETETDANADAEDDPSFTHIDADVSAANNQPSVRIRQVALNDSSASAKQSWLTAATTNESINVDVLLTKHRLFMLEAASGAHLRTNASTLSVNTTSTGASFVDVLDSLALKYLDDAELSRLTRELNASAAVSSSNESRLASQPNSANLTLFGMNANNVSFATRRYLEKHRLVLASSNDREKSELHSEDTETEDVDAREARCVQEREVLSEVAHALRENFLGLAATNHIVPLAISSGVKTTAETCSSVSAAGPLSTIAFESSNSVRFAEASSVRVDGALSSTANHEATTTISDTNAPSRTRHRERVHRHHRSTKTVMANDYPTTASSSTTVTGTMSNCVVESTESSKTKSKRDDRRERRHAHTHKHTEPSAPRKDRHDAARHKHSSRPEDSASEQRSEQAGCAAPELGLHGSVEHTSEQDLAGRILDITRIKQLPKLM